MAKQYYSVLTDYGTQVIAGAIASKQPLQITQMAVGDGEGRTPTPDSRKTGLVREMHRADISAISVDPRNDKQIIFELTIPENVGGFWIREMGIFDNQNRLVAYANCPDSFKPQLESGSGKVQVVRMILLVSSSDAITLKVDDSVIFVTRGQLTPKKITATTKNAVDETGHSHEIDKASTAQAGIVQLTNDTNSDSETLGLTAKAGKTLKALIDALTRNLANYIPNSKKSNSVTSPSSDTVATSAAAKTAYDKGVEANENANKRAMQGKLGSINLNDVTVPGIYGQGYNKLATSDRNYPENKGGTLIVHNDAGSAVHQIYTVYDSGHQYSRGQNVAKQWLNWVRIDAVDKANRVGDEIKMKTIDLNEADGYTYSGFYRPNGDRLNNLPLDGLMMHITHPSYTNNAHARGIGFSYGSYNGNQAWDIFTTAFDANGNYLGKKQILTELHRSDFVTSASSDTVATSKAVKTAYDKAVDGVNKANAAYQRAETAEINAKAASLPITGGNLSGDLIAPYINVTGRYISVNTPNSEFGGFDVIRQGNAGNWLSRLEALPDKRWKFWTQDAYEIFVPAKSGTLAIDHEVVHKTGDTMNWLGIENTGAWLTIKSTGQASSGIDFISHNGRYPQVSLQAFDVGGWADELRIFATPPGNDYNSDRRHHVMTVGHSGDIWTRAYGWLSDRFMDKTKAYDNWYPNHYLGAQVFKIPLRADGSGLKIIIMQVNISRDTELWLPESFNGFYIPTATDFGGGKYSLGIVGLSGNQVKVFCSGSNVTIQVHCIGWSN